MASVTCGLTAKDRDLLRNPTLVWNMGLPYLCACRDGDDDDGGGDDYVDDNGGLSPVVQPCYRQRVTHDVLCLSEEPNNKYRTVQNVTGSDNQYFSLSLSLSLSQWGLYRLLSVNDI